LDLSKKSFWENLNLLKNIHYFVIIMSTLLGGSDFTLSPKALTLIVVAETPFFMSIFLISKALRRDNLRATLAFSEAVVAKATS